MKVFCFLLLLAALVNAVEYNYGPTNAWKSLVTSGLQPGDILNLAAGTYSVSGRWGATLQGTVSNPIVIRRAPSATGVVNFVRQDTQNIIDISNSYNFRFENIQFSMGSGCPNGCRGIRLGPGNVYNAIFDSLTISKPSASGFNANDAGASYYNITLKNSIIRDTSATGECVYVGCNQDACQFYNSLIDRNYCFNTLATTSSQVGSGIQVKTGSYNNIISNNVVYKTKGVGILLYDDYGRGRNIIEGNIITEAGNHGIQVSAGAIVRNNIVVSATLSCIGLIENQLQSGQVVRNVDIIHNTITGAGEACLRINGNAPTNIKVGNNALFCSGKRVTQGAGALTAGVTYANNIGAGTNAPSTGYTAAVITNAVVNPSGLNFYPKTGGPLIGAGSSAYTTAKDFNTLPRSTTSVTVGAYQYSTASNPGPIPTNSGLKQFPN